MKNHETPTIEYQKKSSFPFLQDPKSWKYPESLSPSERTTAALKALNEIGVDPLRRNLFAAEVCAGTDYPSPEKGSLVSILLKYLRNSELPVGKEPQESILDFLSQEDVWKTLGAEGTQRNKAEELLSNVVLALEHDPELINFFLETVQSMTHKTVEEGSLLHGLITHFENKATQ